MELIRDNIWDVFSNTQNLKEFYNKYLDLAFLKQEVPETIKDQVRLVEKLLLHSYYEYHFIDIALMQAVFVFEKALKVKWEEIHGKPTKKNLNDLIDWFFDYNYFETNNSTLPHQLRHIRNGKVHEQTNSLGGIAFLKKVYTTLDLINDLYEDVNLRKHRKEVIEYYSNTFRSFMKNGAILSYEGHRLIVFEAYPVFFNNKSYPNTLTISVCPIFDLTPFENNEHYQPPHLIFNIKDIRIHDGEISGVDTNTENLITLSKIDDEINKKRFLNWSNHLYSLNDWSLILFIITEPLNDCFIECLRDFHRH